MNIIYNNNQSSDVKNLETVQASYKKITKEENKATSESIKTAFKNLGAYPKIPTDNTNLPKADVCFDSETTKFVASILGI